MGFLVKIILCCFIIINLISVTVCIVDKQCAKKHLWRIRESTLLLLSAMGGSISMYVTMRLIHHKTKHKKFMIGIPILIFIQAVIAVIAMRYCGFI